MKHTDVKRYWDGNADAWTRLSRAGYDVYRDRLNTPAFLAMLPDINGLSGLDIGCGEGSNTRILAGRGARITALDISEIFIRHASRPPARESSGADYLVASAVELPFADETFDFATGFMSFMDIPETDCVLAEAQRVLKPGAFLQFSITHPCFATKDKHTLRDEKGIAYAVEIGDYFEKKEGEVVEWLFSAAPPKETEGLTNFKIPVFDRTISEWLNLLAGTGFILEHVEEPRPSDKVVREHPNLQDAQVAEFPPYNVLRFHYLLDGGAAEHRGEWICPIATKSDFNWPRSFWSNKPIKFS
jgi:ubiquinone/menaquinone biosynthesis C-methylase UbiE